MSLLLDHGHPEAMSYPVGMVWDEVGIVVARLNGFEATRAILLQLAVSTLFSKEAGEDFTRVVKRLSGD